MVEYSILVTPHTAAYTWQMGDKLRRIETDFPGERDVWYNYDGLGKRRNKLYANPDDLHWYRWAGWSVLSEYDTAGASGWEVPAAAARVDVAGLAERGAGAAYAYRLHDHLGSVRGLLGASKAPLARYAYAPYGELNHGAGRPLRRGFTGHHWDAESGMYYVPFRYYMPGAGRWLSPDPLGYADGINVYSYVRENPVRFTDSLGLKRRQAAGYLPPGPDPAEREKKRKECLQLIRDRVNDINNRLNDKPGGKDCMFSSGQKFDVGAPPFALAWSPRKGKIEVGLNMCEMVRDGQMTQDNFDWILLHENAHAESNFSRLYYMVNPFFRGREEARADNSANDCWNILIAR